MLLRQNKSIQESFPIVARSNNELRSVLQSKVTYGDPCKGDFGISFMHENNARLSIDKIGLYIDKSYLNKEVYKQFLQFPYCNFFQNNQHVWFFVHAEWDIDQQYHSLRVLSALCYMSLMGAFNQDFCAFIQGLYCSLCILEFNQPEIIAASILQEKVPLRCLEIAMDFEEVPIISNYSIDDFIQVADTTIYSRKDYQVLTRQSGKRIGEKKEEQKSFFTSYDWQLKHGGTKPVYRLELRYYRKYLKALSHDILAGTTISIFNQQLDHIRKTLWHLTIPQHLLFNGIWKTFGPSWFLHFIDSADWNNYKKGRKKTNKRSEIA